jgi:hypothetical protein
MDKTLCDLHVLTDNLLQINGYISIDGDGRRTAVHPSPKSP